MLDVTVSLTSDEALVLFELLHRWEESGAIGMALMSGEQAALWALSAHLENVLIEPFEGDYRELVDQARRRLAERGGAEAKPDDQPDEARTVRAWPYYQCPWP